MERTEAAAILADLKTQFEILDDLANMDWTIFLYSKTPPWFYLESADVWVSDWNKKKLEPWQIAQKEADQKRVDELRARLIDVMAALDLASRTLAGGAPSMIGPSEPFNSGVDGE